MSLACQVVMLFPAFVLAASASAALDPTPSPAAIAVYLAPVDESVLGREFNAAMVEETLRDRLARKSTLRLVEERTREGMRLQVTGCARVEDSAVKRDTERHPPVTLPPGRPRSRLQGIDEDHGLKAETRSFVILAVRVVWEDETRELASGEDDLTLEAAASSVARQIEKLVKRKPRRSAP